MDLLGVEVIHTSQVNEYVNSDYIKINYSEEKLDGISITPVALLFETGIKNINTEYKSFKGIPVIYNSNNSSDITFDVFAASFLLISRYEEYTIQGKDSHDRFMADKSIAYKYNFLQLPVVDKWALILKLEIAKRYPLYKFPVRKFTYIPTIDVDIAFAYKYRNFFRVAGASAKSLLTGNFKDFNSRCKTLLFKARDPFDTYDILTGLFDKYGLQPVFFFLLGSYGRFDKNINPKHKGLKELIIKIGNRYNVGIHPSYGSNNSILKLKTEVELLGKIIKKPVFKSRQHFLKMNLPQTYQNLISTGIKEDFTMGYADMPGFRAGTCTPFKFYDISLEKESDLLIYPFQVMDGTLNQYLRIKPLEAENLIFNIIEEVKKVNGTFISLWHNETLSETGIWKGWTDVYIRMTEEAGLIESNT